MAVGWRVGWLGVWPWVGRGLAVGWRGGWLGVWPGVWPWVGRGYGRGVWPGFAPGLPTRLSPKTHRRIPRRFAVVLLGRVLGQSERQGLAGERLCGTSKGRSEWRGQGGSPARRSDREKHNAKAMVDGYKEVAGIFQCRSGAPCPAGARRDAKKVIPGGHPRRSSPEVIPGGFSRGFFPGVFPGGFPGAFSGGLSGIFPDGFPGDFPAIPTVASPENPFACSRPRAVIPKCFPRALPAMLSNGTARFPVGHSPVSRSPRRDRPAAFSNFAAENARRSPTCDTAPRRGCARRGRAVRAG